MRKKRRRPSKIPMKKAGKPSEAPKQHKSKPSKIISVDRSQFQLELSLIFYIKNILFKNFMFSTQL